MENESRPRAGQCTMHNSQCTIECVGLVLLGVGFCCNLIENGEWRMKAGREPKAKSK